MQRNYSFISISCFEYNLSIYGHVYTYMDIFLNEYFPPLVNLSTWEHLHPHDTNKYKLTTDYHHPDHWVVMINTPDAK